MMTFSLLFCIVLNFYWSIWKYILLKAAKMHFFMHLLLIDGISSNLKFVRRSQILLLLMQLILIFHNMRFHKINLESEYTYKELEICPIFSWSNLKTVVGTKHSA
jgi:hypothetical protein